MSNRHQRKLIRGHIQVVWNQRNKGTIIRQRVHFLKRTIVWFTWKEKVLLLCCHRTMSNRHQRKLIREPIQVVWNQGNKGTIIRQRIHFSKRTIVWFTWKENALLLCCHRTMSNRHQRKLIRKRTIVWFTWKENALLLCCHRTISNRYQRKLIRGHIQVVWNQGNKGTIIRRRIHFSKRTIVWFTWKEKVLLLCCHRTMSNRHQRKLIRGHMQVVWNQGNKGTITRQRIHFSKRTIVWFTWKENALLLCCHRTMSNRHQRKLIRGHIQVVWNQGNKGTIIRQRVHFSKQTIVWFTWKENVLLLCCHHTMSNRHQRKLIRGNIPVVWNQGNKGTIIRRRIHFSKRTIVWFTWKEKVLLLCCHRTMSNRHQRKLIRGHIQVVWNQRNKGTIIRQRVHFLKRTIVWFTWKEKVLLLCCHRTMSNRHQRKLIREPIQVVWNQGNKGTIIRQRIHFSKRTIVWFTWKENALLLCCHRTMSNRHQRKLIRKRTIVWFTWKENALLLCCHRTISNRYQRKLIRGHIQVVWNQGNKGTIIRRRIHFSKRTIVWFTWKEKVLLLCCHRTMSNRHQRKLIRGHMQVVWNQGNKGTITRQRIHFSKRTIVWFTWKEKVLLLCCHHTMSNRHQRKLIRGHMQVAWNQGNKGTIIRRRVHFSKRTIVWFTWKENALLLCCHRTMSNRHQRKLIRGHIQVVWNQGNKGTIIRQRVHFSKQTIVWFTWKENVLLLCCHHTMSNRHQRKLIRGNIPVVWNQGNKGTIISQRIHFSKRTIVWFTWKENALLLCCHRTMSNNTNASS